MYLSLNISVIKCALCVMFVVFVCVCVFTLVYNVICLCVYIYISLQYLNMYVYIGKKGDMSVCVYKDVVFVYTCRQYARYIYFLYIFVGVIMACVHIISKALYIPHLVLSLFVLLFFECHPLLNHGIYLANNKLVGGNS